MTARKTIYDYWGTNTDQLEYRDHRHVRIGTLHKLKGKDKPHLCWNGMHACHFPMNIASAKHSSVTKIYFVRLQGDIVQGVSKSTARERLYMGVITGRDLPEKYVRYLGNGIYHFNFYVDGFNEAVAKAFVWKYPELKDLVEKAGVVK